MDSKRAGKMRLTSNGDGRYEVHPCHQLEEDDAMGMELCDDFETCTYPFHIWSVYEHQASGGIECFADYNTRALAEAVADGLELYEQIEGATTVWVKPLSAADQPGYAESKTARDLNTLAQQLEDDRDNSVWVFLDQVANRNGNIDSLSASAVEILTTYFDHEYEEDPRDF